MSSKSVLIVDDDDSIRKMVRSVLSHEGFEVEDAPTGNQAIALMTRKCYDAVVLDVMMADGTGQDVLRSLAATRPGVKCVVVISASSLANIEKLEGGNVQARLRKPFDITALVVAVRECVTSPNGAASRTP